MRRRWGPVLEAELVALVRDVRTTLRVLELWLVQRGGAKDGNPLEAFGKLLGGLNGEPRDIEGSRSGRGSGEA